MSFICVPHGWRHGQSPCPVCEHLDLQSKMAMQQFHKNREIYAPLSGVVELDLRTQAERAVDDARERRTP